MKFCDTLQQHRLANETLILLLFMLNFLCDTLQQHRLANETQINFLNYTENISRHFTTTSLS